MIHLCVNRWAGVDGSMPRKTIRRTRRSFVITNSSKRLPFDNPVTAGAGAASADRSKVEGLVFLPACQKLQQQLTKRTAMEQNHNSDTTNLMQYIALGCKRLCDIAVAASALVS